MNEVMVKVSEGWRVVIPASFREELNLHLGDNIIFHKEGERLYLSTVDQTLKYARALVKQKVGKKSLVAALRKERDEEFRKEVNDE